MLAGEPSQTAIRCTILRAAHQVLDDDPKIPRDPIAVGLVAGSREEELRANVEALQSPLFRAIRAILVMRSRYVEDLLKEAAASGVGQYVLLGAGLDTFAYRQPPWASPLSLFEIDHPATQEWKRTTLKQLGIPLPTNLRFCPVDFETTSLPESLTAVAFDFRRAAFFSWLGVTQYLTDTAIDSTLRFILSLPTGSGIVFTFVLPDSSIDPEDSALLATAAGGWPLVPAWRAGELYTSKREDRASLRIRSQRTNFVEHRACSPKIRRRLDEHLGRGARDHRGRS